MLYGYRQVNNTIFKYIWIYRENFLDIEDLKKCTQFLEQNFSEDELEELLELSGKSNGKLTFDNFM